MRYLLTALLAATILVGGIGMATAQQATPTAGTSASVAYTNIRFFLPYTPDGPASGLTVTSEASGVCLEQSLADIGRADAWVCVDSMSNEQFDPCFENPFESMDDPSELICPASPFSTDVVHFTLTEPLRRQKEMTDEAGQPPMLSDQDPRKGKKAHRGAGRPVPPVDTAEMVIDPLDIPWALELANGDRCTLLTGATAVLAGERLNYGCESGGSVLGELDRSGPVWMVFYLAKDAYASDLVPVAVVWT
jgi:hypothetical protein